MHCWVGQICLYTYSQISEYFIWDSCFFFHTDLPIYPPTCLCTHAHMHTNTTHSRFSFHAYLPTHACTQHTNIHMHRIHTLLLFLPHLPAYAHMHTNTHTPAFHVLDHKALNNLRLQMLEEKRLQWQKGMPHGGCSHDFSVVVHKDGTTGQVLINAECLLCTQTALKTAGFSATLSRSYYYLHLVTREKSTCPKQLHQDWVTMKRGARTELCQPQS